MERTAFIQAFSSFCSYMLCYKPKLNDFNGHSLKNFRNKHSEQYTCIRTNLKLNDEKNDELNINNCFSIYIVRSFILFDDWAIKPDLTLNTINKSRCIRFSELLISLLAMSSLISFMTKINLLTTISSFHFYRFKAK